MDDVYTKLEKLIEKELDKIAVKGDITPPELEMATKAMCLLEKIKMVESPESASSYSMGRMPYRRSNNLYGDYYSDDRYNNYSNDRGYSSHSVRDRMIAQLETSMMDNAQSESEKKVIESLISQLGSGSY